MGQVITIAQQKGGAGKTTLAANLAAAFAARGRAVALLDTDPQGSLGRWFLARRALPHLPGLEFSTASAWGVSYECEKLKKTHDLVIVDTPPKVDADLRPALREAGLVLIPVSASHVDLWAVDGVLDLVAREGRRAMIVLNRMKAGTRLAASVAAAAGDLAAGAGASVAPISLAQRVSYAETLGRGASVMEAAGPARDEVNALADAVLAGIQS